MKMIILCGGLGLRLREAIGEKQKTMADINGKPFLEILIEFYKKQNIKNFIFAAGYKNIDIKNYFEDGKKFDIDIEYAIEDTPLGTAGAIKNCLDYIDEEKIIVINGDTFFNANIDILNSNMIKYNSDMAIFLKKVDDNGRFGTVVMDNESEGIITSFNEKINTNNKLINAGIYIIKKQLIKTIPSGNCSLEKQVIPNWLEQKFVISGKVIDDTFVDIGTPESLINFKNSLI